MNDLDSAVQKASLLLDLKGNRAEAVQVLMGALAASESTGPSRVRTLVFLGELMLESDPEGARRHLSSALSETVEPDWDDSADADLARARLLLEAHVPDGTTG